MNLSIIYLLDLINKSREDYATEEVDILYLFRKAIEVMRICHPEFKTSCTKPDFVSNVETILLKCYRSYLQCVICA
jgi:hypothetical protein